MRTSDFFIEQMESYRFLPISDELFDLYDSYEQYCQETNDCDGLLLLDFYRGETDFRLGRYQLAQSLINRCLLNRQPHTPLSVIANCYNIIGLIHCAMGYEYLALENYLLALDAATQDAIHDKEAVILVNIGWLYRDLGDFEKALSYYDLALQSLSLQKNAGPYSLEILCYSYIGQIHFATGNASKGLQILDEIQVLQAKNPTVFYDISVENLYIRAYYYLQDEKKFTDNIHLLLINAKKEEDFLEFSEGYFDVCRYLIDIHKEYARQLLDILYTNVQRSDIPFLKLKLQALEVLYHENYSSREDYSQACATYMDIQKVYNMVDRKAKLSSMHSIDALREAQKNSALYLEQSKKDLMTGLFNKVSFEQQIIAIFQSQNHNQLLRCALAIIDLDHFKRINDAFGHAKGDMVLLDTVHYMQHSFEDTAIFGRVGGDEFAVFWSNVHDIQDIRAQAEAMRQCYALHSTVCQASVSMGIACSSYDSTYQELFEKADCCLYQAKRNGRDNIIFFEQ